jgi:hypothetical protein
MYAAQRPYASLTQEQIVDRVIRKGMRPTFPSAAPAAFVNLASRCWDADPKMRPSFVEISATLKEIINGEDGGGS